GDALYRAAVLLDTVGEPLANPPLVLAEALAVAPHVTPGLPWGGRPAWRLDGLAARTTDPTDRLTAALDALAGLPQPLDFVHGWALAPLRPLLAESGLISEALVAALGGLSDRFGCRAEAVSTLLAPGDPRREFLCDPDPFPGLLADVRAVGDAYL